jgi:membrane associated rhomboid family serine protease
MGIYDRDYYRREGPSYLDSFTLRGQATKWIIVATGFIFVLQILTRVQRAPGLWFPGFITTTFSLDPELVLHGEVWRLVTYAFLHSDGGGSNFWMHIVFNMWMLWLFGGYIEDIYGRWEFLTFYLTAALVGGLAYMAEYLVGIRAGVCIGASGAVTASMVLCAFYHPRLTILLFFVIPVPIWVLAIFQVAQDALGFLSAQPGTAFSVHLGGAAFGALYFQSKIRILKIGDWFRGLKLGRARARLRVYAPQEESREPVPVLSGPEIDEQLEAKLDAVLEKVAQQGKESLSESERQILMRASEIYKRRRS